ncbi:MAG: RNA polymerase sigma factor, partial [Myxococcota bacterium]
SSPRPVPAPPASGVHEALAPQGAAPAPIDALSRAALRELDRRLFAYVRRRVPGDEIAREIVQKTWVAAVAGQARFSGRSSVSTWVHGILRRKLADHYRERREERALLEDELVVPARQGDTFDARQRLQRVASALEALPMRERRAVEGCVLEMGERTELAEELGVNTGHLRCLLFRGRARLRAA